MAKKSDFEKISYSFSQVSEDGLAAKGGICLGDIILDINGIDAKDLRLAQAHELINKSAKKLSMIAKG